MDKEKQLIGKKFSRLEVVGISMSKPNKNGRTYVMLDCKCECGKFKSIYKGSILQGLSRSCGCIKKESITSIAKKNKKHGMSFSSEYEAWIQMKARCNNKYHRAYENYGGRGISVCKRWMDSFDNFLLDMGVKPSPELSLDRIDNNKGYFPGNCRWATWIEQANNQRISRKARFLTYKGETKIVADWARELGININTMRVRIHRGMSIDGIMRK